MIVFAPLSLSLQAENISPAVMETGTPRCRRWMFLNYIRELFIFFQRATLIAGTDVVAGASHGAGCFSHADI